MIAGIFCNKVGVTGLTLQLPSPRGTRNALKSDYPLIDGPALDQSIPDEFGEADFLEPLEVLR
jgi:hypothetical protein